MTQLLPKRSAWKKAARGIYFRTQAGRKHGVRLDRYYVLKHSAGGKQITEALGWESQGWTVARVQAELSQLQEAKRTGKGPVTLRERTEANRRAETQRAEEEAALVRRQKTVADLWDRYSKEIVAVENKPRTISEKVRMWTRRINPVIGQLKINRSDAVVGGFLRPLEDFVALGIFDLEGKIFGASRVKGERL